MRLARDTGLSARKSGSANRGRRAPSPVPLLREEAYEAIKHKIITCAFKPGEYLNEALVCDALGMGRTPVHQAIDRLMLEGMVEVIPRKGVIVRPVSLDEIIQITEVRQINEIWCVRLAADLAAEDEIAAMQDVLRRSKAVVAERNAEQSMLLDREFHLLLAKASKNDVLANVLGNLHDRSLRFWFISLNAPGHHGDVLAQHHEILAAIEARDPAAAEAAMRNHIDDFRQNVSQYVSGGRSMAMPDVATKKRLKA